jgi:AraC family transcriptional regulator of adaptative response/methylated-DNA-[protein]-cysteine methyltransferase
MVTYKSIASRMGDAKASRAVGTAVGRNPISWLIPCHRVLGSDGALHGYHWGLVRKRAMLAMEAARAELRQTPSTSAIA